MNRLQSIDDLLAAEYARTQALVAGDSAALSACLHENLVYVHATGVRHDLAQYLRFAAEGPRFLAVDLRAPVVELHASMALVTGELLMSLQRVGEATPINVRSWVSAVWLCGSSGWQLRSFQSTRQEAAHV